MNTTQRRHLATVYERLLGEVFPLVCADGEERVVLPPEMEIQACWAGGLLGDVGETQRHGTVRILDPGTWNRSAGPDFLRAEIEINGERRRGDVEIDPEPQDWERHGHGANPSFNQVVLHVTLTRPEAGWYTRNSMHEEVPVLYVPPAVWQAAMGQSPSRRDESVCCCRRPLAQMPAERIDSLLKTAAAYRMEKKRRHFHRKAEVLGRRQTWFEAWAETLGYAVNKQAMQMLTRRAPLKLLEGNEEAVLLGTAGFLLSVLPERSTEEARVYHRRVWDNWWAVREQFELSHEHAIPWVLSPVRPMNHPQRRVAALAISAAMWRRVEPHLNAAGVGRLRELLQGISHPYWDVHCTLASAALARPSALVGKQRVDDFLVNHVYVQDESDYSWQTYLSLRAPSMPSAVQRTAQALFGEREDMRSILTKQYAIQALLQIDTDFCSVNICGECMFPGQLSDWG